MTYDCTEDIKKHIKRVSGLLMDFRVHLFMRGRKHDASKLESPEKEAYDQMTPRLNSQVYGSEEYKATLEEFKYAVNHHYLHNSHHPQYHQPVTSEDARRIEKFLIENSGTLPKDVFVILLRFSSSLRSRVGNMSLLDIVEMLADWKAASEQTKGGDIRKSIEIGRERFGISDQLYGILMNTVEDMDW